MKGKSIFLLCGLLMVTLGYIPYLVLGKGCVIGITDQLDDEIINYVIAAKHFLDGQTVYPEMMCGLSRESMIPVSGFSVLLYVMFSPFHAFIINQYLILLTAFAGMYLLCEELLGERFFSFCSAVIFSYLPFFSVYGLSIAGVPVLFYALVKLYQNHHRILYYGIVMVYCFCSAFHLTGYVVVGGTLMISLVCVVRKDRRKYFFLATLMLLAGYIVQDYPLILQMVGIGGGGISHREEFVISGMGFWEGFCTVFLDGFDHAVSYHRFITPLAILTAFYGMIRYRSLSREGQREIRLIWGLLSAAVLIAVFFAVFHCHVVVVIRNKMGGMMKYFQVDRFYWFYPAIWYLMLACVCTFIYRHIFARVRKKFVARSICVLLLAVTGFYVLWNSNFKKNFRQLVNSETSNQITWEDFYSEKLFCEVAAYIKDQSGMEQEEYRVGSVGIHPAAAVMNGFHTIDGYSNNYSLEYKHRFREIIAYELSQNEYNRNYFDHWGSRCYLFASDYDGCAFTGEKEDRAIYDFWIDCQKMKEMGCCYILSAVEIMEPEWTGLSLCQVFEREDSYYRIYLYQVNGWGTG